MKQKFKKVKTVHHLIEGFDKLLLSIEKHPHISKIIPGRIDRQQKGSSTKRFRIKYNTHSGLKCIMSQGATAQELFIICPKEHTKEIKNHITLLTLHY